MPWIALWMLACVGPCAPVAEPPPGLPPTIVRPEPTALRLAQPPKSCYQGSTLSGTPVRITVASPTRDQLDVALTLGDAPPVDHVGARRGGVYTVASPDGVLTLTPGPNAMTVGLFSGESVVLAPCAAPAAAP